MANIRGFRDINQNENRNRPNRGPANPNNQLSEEIPFMNSMQSDRPPL
jgi:hypothetical protein